MSLKRSDTDLVSVTQPPLLSDVENRYLAWREDMDIWDSFSTLQNVRKGLPSTSRCLKTSRIK